MKSETSFAMKNFQNALSQLKQGVQTAGGALERDGVIQRFEFTFELLWKTLKLFMKNKGFECVSPKDCLKMAFKIGYIRDERTFLDMLEDRNKTAHLYDQKESEKVFLRIKESYLVHFEGVLKKLEDEIKDQK